MRKTQSIEWYNIDKENYIRVNLLCGVKKEKTGIYLSYCPALDLASQGSTQEEAAENISEAIDLFIESCLRRNTLKAVFAEVKKAKASYKTAPSAKNRLTVPVYVPAGEMMLQQV